ncbi:MAG: transglycosylase domain-containing protein [Deltaproteobacteria bacterium]|nr:MAG: transglycosylase domain-containing protein [Deltaproteobacteria bacterium]
MDRKVKEAILATQIEQRFSKEEIIYIYLNQIYLGNRAYGVKAAARNYFHKDLKDLTLAEMTLIAGLPSAPSTYSPIHNREMARQRQVRVLERMLVNRYITKAEYEQAINERVPVYRWGLDKDYNYRYAPFFVEHIRRVIEEKYGTDALYNRGLRIETTANVLANQAADRAVKRGLFEVEKRKGFSGPVATLTSEKIKTYADAIHRELVEFDEPIPFPADPALDAAQKQSTETPLKYGLIYKGVIAEVDAKGNAQVLVGHNVGNITAADRAWTGRTPKVGDIYWVRKKDPDSNEFFLIEQEPKLESALFSYEPQTGDVKAIVGGFSFRRSEFNRATQALRQPGSSFKPLIYSAALDKGYSPKSVIVDGPVSYQVGREIWSPKNYGNKYNGPMTLRSALTNSVNIVAVKIFHDIGIDYVTAYARKFGLTTPIAHYLSSALGASDVNLQELARAYGTFPNGGVRPELHFIRKITDKTGAVLEENPPTTLDVAHVFDGALDEQKKSDDFNTDLKIEGEKSIKNDKLKISKEEMKVLYGSEIPTGHVITARTAMLMVSMMKNVVENGTGYKAKELKRPAAGKTGTTNNESDAWFMAYIPNLVTGVWLGYDSRKPIGPKMTGGVVSAPIWLYYMQEYLKDQPVLDFAFPKLPEGKDLDDFTGGSAPVSAKPAPEGGSEDGSSPGSRGVDFLYKDLNGL